MLPAARRSRLGARTGRISRRGPGADDVGFVEIERPAPADQLADITAVFPHPRALISFVSRTSREAVRPPARSVGNLEFHQTYDRTNEIARDVVTARCFPT